MMFQKVLYTWLKGDLLFYNKLFADLLWDGFVFNPYDACIVDKEINVKQMTITW